MRVVRQDDTEIQLQGGTRGRHHAHLGLHPADGHVVHARFGEQIRESGLLESVVDRLAQHPLAPVRVCRQVYLPAGSAGFVDGSRLAVVLELDDEGARGAGPRDQVGRPVEDTSRFGHGAVAGDEGGLHVDDDQRLDGLRGMLLLGMGLRGIRAMWLRGMCRWLTHGPPSCRSP
ncbi:hypothetical protein GCM10010449_59580 [Streptomyces rectiviolaceus]|uniref:Transposase n=1 Tax=Streptomyces rectiviolaceus TaxID=332591 RepID=A0ABP6N042_9ACTN